MQDAKSLITRRYEGDTACDGDLKRVSTRKGEGTLLAIDGLKSHIIRKDAGTVPAIERFLHDLLQTSEGTWVHCLHQSVSRGSWPNEMRGVTLSRAATPEDERTLLAAGKIDKNVAS